jgi:hypothetical protein
MSSYVSTDLARIEYRKRESDGSEQGSYGPTVEGSAGEQVRQREGMRVKKARQAGEDSGARRWRSVKHASKGPHHGQ